MSVNPFHYGKPIEDLERFIGHQRELEQIYSRLTSAFESTSIVGERRTGKTSLLKAVAHPETQARFGLDNEKYIFLYQDFRFLDADTVPTRFWRRVLRAIKKEIKAHPDVADEIDVALKAEAIDNYTLDDVFTLIDEEEIYIVLLLDEFENVTRNENFDSDFFGGLRALAIHHNLALITSSRQSLVELTHSESVRSSPFFNIFANINLKLFTEEEAAELVERYLTDSGVRFLLSELNVIFAVAGYHPYFLQMAGYHLFAAYQQELDDGGRRRYLIDKMRSEALPLFQDYWHYASPSEKTLLTVMALRELERNGGEDTVENLERFYARAPQVMGDLEQRSLVIKNPDNSAYHLFSTEMREWIADEIVGDVDDLRAWRNWEKDESTLVGVLPEMVQGKLSQVTYSLNPAYRKELGNWLLEPATADDAVQLLETFLERYEHYKGARPQRDAASTMADEKAPIGDTPRGLFARVGQRLDTREQGIPPEDLPQAEAPASGEKAPEYVNFDLEVQRREAAYVAQGASSLAGETEPMSFSPPFSDEQVGRLVEAMSRQQGASRNTPPREEVAREFGGKLFQAVFQGPLRDLLMTSLARAKAQKQGLRLRLRLSNVPELADWPWEYLYPGPEVDFLALSHKTPLVRYPDVMQPVQPLEVERPLHILAVAASPQDLPLLDTDREQRNLETALGQARDDGHVKLTWLAEPSLATLRQELISGLPYHILHFIGHSKFNLQSQGGFLAFVDKSGNTDPVDSMTFARTLMDCDSLRLVVLNSCEGARGGRQDPFGSVAATLIQRGLPAVVAMQFEISDVAAVTFSTDFYRALGQGWPVDTAVTEARMMMALKHRTDVEWGFPALYLRASDGHIFNFG